MKKIITPLMAISFAVMPCGIHAQNISATLPITCNPNVPGDCTRAIPVVNPDGTNISGGGGTSGGATEATLQSVDTSTNEIAQDMNTVLANQTAMSAKLPASLGAKTGATSLSVVPATDGIFAMQGTVADAAANSGNPLLGGAVYIGTTLPTYAAGQRTTLQSDARGNLRSLQAMLAITGADAMSNTLGQGLNSVSTSSGLPFQVTPSVFNGTTWDRSRSMQATDMSAGLGVNAVGTVPTSAASQALAYTSTAGAATNVLKASAGNVYGFNLVNSTTAVFAIVYDAVSAPASGTSLTTASIKYCFPVAASAGFDKVFNPPVRVTTGAVLLASTSCTTYTAPSALPVVLIGEAM